MSRMINGSYAMTASCETPAWSLREWLSPILDLAPDEINAEQSLIEQGLDSISIMRLPALLAAQRGVQVSFAELIETPVLRAWEALASNAVADERGGGTDEIDSSQPFELTPLQQAYWLGRQAHQSLGGVACQLYQELEGAALEPERLRQAIDLLRQRHGMLRACFLPEGRQVIQPEVESFTLTVHHLQDDESAAVDDYLEALRETLSHRRLNIEAGQVFDVQLSLLPEGRTRLHLNIDLLVADVLSLGVILRDLATFYRGEGDSLPDLTLSFPAYLKAVNQRQSPSSVAADQAYWRECLSHFSGPPQLPLRCQPEQLEAPRFTRRQMMLSHEQVAALESHARHYGVTLAAALATAYGMVLARWSQHPRFILNLPLFDRQFLTPDVADMVADFSNLVLLPMDFSSSACFVDAARSVQHQLHQNMAHNAWPGVEVLREWTQQGGQGAPVVFACNLGTPFMDRASEQTLGQPGWALSQTPQVWLDHQSYPMADGVLLNWDAVDALFPEGLLDDLFSAYCALLNQLIAGDWSSEFTIALPESQQRQRQRTNDTHHPLVAQQSAVERLHSGLFAQARITPERWAVMPEQGPFLTYQALADQALAVAGALQEAGVCPGDGVVVTSPKGAEQVVAVVGVLACGAHYIPVGMEQPIARRSAILRQAGVNHVLTIEAECEIRRWPQQARLISIEQAVQHRPLPEPVNVAAEDLAYVIFTSGSTGMPKGVEITHQAAMNTLAGLQQRYAFNADDRVLGLAALDFDLSVFDLFALWRVGGALVLPDEAHRKAPEVWWSLIQQHRVTIWNSVPALLDMWLLCCPPERAFASLRYVLLSGDWIGLDLPERLASVCPHAQFLALGGATEASIWSNIQDVSLPLPAHWRTIPYGHPLANQCFRVVDTQGQDCPDWVAGELWIGGAGVARGYRAQPQLTAERFVESLGQRWYRTGDRGRYWPDGTLEFLGREDHQVKVRGFRIELAEIETALMRHPAVSRAMAMVLPGDSPTLVAAVLVDDAQPMPEVADIQTVAAQWLPSHMLPEYCDLRQDWPLSRNGKVDREQLLHHISTLIQHTHPEVEERPQGELEHTIAQHWCDLLALDEVGRHQRFFSVGGNSLLATRLLDALSREFNLTLKLSDFFEATSVADQAALLKQQGVIQHPQAIEKASTIEEGAL